MRRMKHAARGVSLGLVLACTVVTFSLGVAQKAPCMSGQGWGASDAVRDPDGREAYVQYRRLCYSDLVPLLGTEQLAGGRLPFLDPCVKNGGNCDEYPVLTMYLMRAAGWVAPPSADGVLRAGDYSSFYLVNAFMLGVFAAATAYALWRLAGRRALWFALAPTLLIYGTVNWDLFAVMLTTLALLAYAVRQDEWSGGLLGLGAAAKFYPAFLVVPLFLQGLRDRQPDRSVRVLWWSAGAWLAVNLPFAIVATTAWWEFFRFNASRAADFDSLWYIACDHGFACMSVRTIGFLSAAGAIGVVALVWWRKARRDPNFAPWTLGLPILLAFLLANKVYSPQYGLWLLPWFALLGTNFRLFVAFEVTEVLVFATRFRFFGGLADQPWGWPEAWFQWAVLLRAAILILLLLDWVRREAPPLAVVMGRLRSEAAAPGASRHDLEPA
jgi:uncharacterized membrane protein